MLASQFIKLILAPLVALVLLLILGLKNNADLVKVAVFELGDAEDSRSAWLTRAQYKLDLRLATALVFTSFVFSLVTMVIWLALFIH